MPNPNSSLSCLSPSSNFSSGSYSLGTGDGALQAPPPAPSRGPRLHQRSQTALFSCERNLPPLLTDETRQPRRPQPLLSRSSFALNTPTLPPLKSLSKGTPDKDLVFPFSKGTGGKIVAENKRLSLASWFNGSSDPVNLMLVSSPVKEKADPFATSTDQNLSRLSLAETVSTAVPSKKMQKNTTSPTTPSEASTTRFSWFRSKTSETAELSSMDDELLNLDIEGALFGTGTSDPFSPSSFKNLQLNAEGTIKRYKSAYRQSKQALQAMGAHEDELEAVQTKAEHLKCQLNDMATRAKEQEDLMRKLAEELAFEKRRRCDEEEARKRSIKLVQEPSENEKIETASRRLRNRTSAASSFQDSDLASEVGSCADSIFSEPTRAETPTTPLESSPESFHIPRFPQSPQKTIGRPGMPIQRLSTYQKVLHDLSSTTVSEPYVQVECGNCKGLKGSDAWDLVRVLQAENKGLKQRLGQLESAQDDALDFVNSLTLGIAA